MTKTVLIYKRFERFWHWSQAVLIIGLMITGFNIHGTIHLLGFSDATNLHVQLAWLLIGLWCFAIFWHLTTGEWRHYIPTSEKLLEVAYYYTRDIFYDKPHPYKKRRAAKHNPLQRLAYLIFKLFISPLIWISGLLYLYYNSWNNLLVSLLDIGVVATVHTIAAFTMLVFFIAHAYMATLGKTPLTLIKTMITGYTEE